MHQVAQDAGLHTGSNLCSAGRLGAVADGAGEDGHSVDDGVGDGVVVCPLQIGDTGPGAHACADCAAVSGQTADPGLLVDGHQIADQQRPVELLLRCAQILCVTDNRQGSGHSLIA